jgi:transposase
MVVSLKTDLRFPIPGQQGYGDRIIQLDEWINEAQKYDIPELQTFINGIKKDLTAIKNGIIYSYNNGLAEGSVNKIKVIKRIMYGRNSFELLKAKVLFGELFHVKFN